MNKSRTHILELIRHIAPMDAHERMVVREAVVWIRSGADLYRVRPPDEPPKHLVSYVVVIDRRERSVLMCDHLKSGLWLPLGGHVEHDENPAVTAARELEEELGLPAAQAATVADVPFFITANVTRGQGKHIDVSLWYVVEGRKDMPLAPDPGEFRGVAWFTFEEVLDMDIDRLDPQMHRFMSKLIANLVV